MVWQRNRSVWLGLFLLLNLILLLAALAYPMMLYVQGTVEFRTVPISVWYVAALAYLGLIAAIVYWTFLSVRQREQAAAKEFRWEVQERVLEALREQRHDVLNELTLALSYLEVGRVQEGRQVLEYLAVTLSDRYQTNSLPEDAWLTIIRVKGEEAKRRRIRLDADISGPAPSQPVEQRLLPRIIGNLLDNAFDAAQQADEPHVVISWDQLQDKRQLTVKNNGHCIAAEDAERIFEPGFTTKGGEARGWGLPICRKMAGRLEGSLHHRDKDGYTVFTLVLPTQVEAAADRQA